MFNGVAAACNAIYATGRVLNLAGVEITVMKKNEQIEDDTVIAEEVKDDVVIIIDFNQTSIVESVERFLTAKRIDSTTFVCKNPNVNRILDVDDRDQWSNAVEGVYKFINGIEKGKRMHIFINAPVALSFAIGYALRPNYAPYVYHYNNRRDGHADSELYSRVLHVNDNLRGY